ncbi:MAG: MarC family protein [Acidobacteria bacterium]|nr:MarC family protein [Acidobacteriota bacterium]
MMVVLFNPFLMTVYLMEVIRDTNARLFLRILARAFAISGVVFLGFAFVGEQFFSRVLQVDFASFLIFGGIVFLLIAVRFIVFGAPVMTNLRGSPEHISGSIAMPFMIGPGTVSASVMAGTQQPLGLAAGSIILALIVSCVLLLGMKYIHDHVRRRNAGLVERYSEIVGRASALIIGTLAIDMVIRGVKSAFNLG